jgi:prephenate dehydrogenase
MTPQAHDTAFAAVSHLPHLLAFAMINAIQAQPQSQALLALAGPGFRDFTRIAASDPKIWRDILLANRLELLNQSQLFQAQLRAFEALMESSDAQALETLIHQASATRAQWHMNKP